MPEVSIGFFPDVGATWFLPRLPGELGTYCALTGERLGADDGVRAGVATHRVSSARLADLLDGLCGTVPVDALLGAFAEPVQDTPLAKHSSAIDRLFCGDKVEDILAALANADGAAADWANATAQTIGAKCPLSVKLALAQMRRGRNWTFDECMRAEFRIVSRIVHGPNFYEGIRAVIVEKDNAPRWQPAALADVTDAEVERHFAPLPGAELALP
jgi:enoyl-CoA hydratase